MSTGASMPVSPDGGTNLRHELRTPVNHIVGYAELLLEDADAPGMAALAPALGDIAAAGRQALTLINDALDPAGPRSPSAGGELRVLLDAVLERAASLIRRAGEQGAEQVVPDLERIASAAGRLLALVDQVFGPAAPDAGPPAADPTGDGPTGEPATALAEAPAAVGTGGALLVVDDDEANRDVLARRLERLGYGVTRATNGKEALRLLETLDIDLMLLDIMMPEMDGYQVLERRRGDPRLRDIPVVMMSAVDEIESVVRCIEMGAEDYLTKPFDPVLLQARIGACLEKKRLRDQEKRLLDTVRAQAAQLAEWNHTLEARVEEKVEEVVRLRRLRRFLSPQLADVIISTGAEHLLESHRREITVVFCDMRGFTAFSETADPEEVMGVLRAYHAMLGPLIHAHQGTLEHFAGDGMMVFFNDPIPCDDPARRAVEMAVAMRRSVEELQRTWRRHGHELGFGVGVAIGYATCGRIGFEGRFDYGAIGNVTIMAARLCAEAAAGQILVSQRIHAAVEDLVEAEPVGELTLKGFHRPVPAFNVLGLRT